MSVTPDREAEPTVQPTAAPPSGIANPAPLGLAAFALTTFLLSAANAHWMKGNATGDAWLPYALAYGGIAQFLAGMWEFRNKNVFGATAFSTYGAFWIGLFFYVRLVAAPRLPARGGRPGDRARHPGRARPVPGRKPPGRVVLMTYASCF